MSPQDFPTFFKAATSNAQHDYQRRLGESACASRLINIPTDLGKTRPRQSNERHHPI